ncbi:MAG: hypothetical protein EOO71_21425 [Myxococcaceae bacterium]|nr:MAG: hypothetical protein EOO71_21425 [Myxococcaceae bacterium]
MPIVRLSLPLAATALLASSSALACDFNLLEEPAVKWDTCGALRFADDAEEAYGEGFKLAFDKESFDKYYANIQKTTEVGDLNRDTHDPDSYCDDGFSWLGVGPFDRSSGNWITHILSGKGNSDDDVQFLAKKAHDEYISKVRGITCRMNPKGKQPELKLEGTTLVIEVVPRKCSKKKGCDENQGRNASLGDFHAYVYWTWMSPFFADHLPAYKKAAQVIKKKYPTVPLP